MRIRQAFKILVSHRKNRKLTTIRKARKRLLRDYRYLVEFLGSLDK
jgi:hypothetical protein